MIKILNQGVLHDRNVCSCLSCVNIPQDQKHRTPYSNLAGMVAEQGITCNPKSIYQD
jgi:hypothetical protein